MALLRHLMTVSGWTAASRVLGFLRDILIAQTLGTGPVADVFFVAFRLPNMFRRIFAEGAFNAAFVPLFARRLEQEGQESARRFAEEALSALVTALLVLTVVIILIMPWFIVTIGSGFLQDAEKYALGVELSRITFPYLLFISVMALYSGILNALYRFKAAAAAPILLNVLFIAMLLFAVPWLGQVGHVLAWTVALAGILQCAVVVIAARRAGMTLRPRWPRLTPGVRRLIVLMGPGVLSAAVLQINLLIGTNIATYQAGAVSYLYYADRVYQLPLGLIGIAFGVVLLPDLSRKLRSGADAAAMTSLNRGLEMSMALTIPAAVALAVIAEPIVVVLFERGAFDAGDSLATAMALAAFAAGLPAYVLVKVLQPAFFAREDTMTPLRFAGLSVLTNIGLSLFFFFGLGWGHVGIAAATAVAAWLNAGLLSWRLRQRAFLTLDTRCRRSLPKLVLASLIMGAGLWLAMAATADWFALGLWAEVAVLALLVGGGLGLYAALTLGLGALKLADLKALFRRT